MEEIIGASQRHALRQPTEAETPNRELRAQGSVHAKIVTADKRKTSLQTHRVMNTLVNRRADKRKKKTHNHGAPCSMSSRGISVAGFSLLASPTMPLGLTSVREQYRGNHTHIRSHTCTSRGGGGKGGETGHIEWKGKEEAHSTRYTRPVVLRSQRALLVPCD